MHVSMHQGTAWGCLSLFGGARLLVSPAGPLGLHGLGPPQGAVPCVYVRGRLTSVHRRCTFWWPEVGAKHLHRK